EPRRAHESARGVAEILDEALELSTATNVIAGVLQLGPVPNTALRFSSRVARGVSFLDQTLGDEVLVVAQFVRDLAGYTVVVASALQPVAENSKHAHGFL